MPVHRSDQLTKTLTGTYVDNRLINWLWFHIPYKHPTANLGEYKSHGMTDRMADFIIKNPTLKTDIEQAKAF